MYKDVPRDVVSALKSQHPSLRCCIEWRRGLWVPAVRWVLGDTRRFEGKRVLDLGCRYGLMSCYFASLGANVTGLDISTLAIKQARSLCTGLHFSGQLDFQDYDGDLSAKLPPRSFDVVFTKSVLVVMGDLPSALKGIAQVLKPEGSLLAVENAKGSSFLNLIRKYAIHRRWKQFDQVFSGMAFDSIGSFKYEFDQVHWRRFWGLVYAIRAERPRVTHPNLPCCLPPAEAR